MPTSVRIMTWLVALLVSACAPSITTTPTPTTTDTPTLQPTPTATPAFVPRSLTTDPSQQVGLRFVHAATSVDAVDVYAELLAVATRLLPGQVAGEARVASGSYTFRVVPVGQSIDGDALAAATLSLEGSRRYTLIIGGDGGAITLTALPDDNSPVPARASRVQLVNAASGAPPIQLSVEGTDAVISDLAFARISPSTVVNAGRATLQIEAGSTSLEVPIELRENRHYTIVVALDPDSSAGLKVTVLDVEIPGQAQVRIVQGLAADIGPVDVYADDQQIASALVFGSASDLAAVPARVASLTVLPAGADRSAFPLLAMTFAPNSNDEITLLLSGDSTSAFATAYTADAAPLQADQTRVTFVNLYSNVLTLIGRTDTTFGENGLILQHGASPPSFVISSGTVEITWVASANEDTQPTTLFTQTTEFQAGRNYLYVITGRPDAPTLLFSNPVIERTDASEESETASIRLVNALEEGAASFQLNDLSLAEDIAPRSGSGLIAVTPGDHNLFVYSATAGAFIEVTLDTYSRHSIYVSGSVNDPFLVIIQEREVTFAANTGRIRLVQLGRPGQSDTLALGFSAASANASGANVAVTPFPQTPGSQAVSIPFGVRELVRGVASGQASLMGQLPVGLYDFYIIDSASSSVIGLLPAFDLRNREAYEIVAAKSFADNSLTAFILPYPPASD